MKKLYLKKKKKSQKTTFPIIPCLKNYKYTDIH